MLTIVCYYMWIKLDHGNFLQLVYQSNIQEYVLKELLPRTFVVIVTSIVKPMQLRVGFGSSNTKRLYLHPFTARWKFVFKGFQFNLTTLWICFFWQGGAYAG